MASSPVPDHDPGLPNHWPKPDGKVFQSAVPRVSFPGTEAEDIPMIKLVYCITRRPGMTRAEFSHYWKHVHGPIGARIPGLRRLVQSHATTSPGDRAEPDFDGMAELWFDDWDALLEARRSPEWRASGEDEKNFIDEKRVAYFVTTEHEISVGDP
jgi:uncharacterized protein (TIGR02118 family)